LEKQEWTTEEMQWLLNELENSKGSDLEEMMKKYFSVHLRQGSLIDETASSRMLAGLHRKIAELKTGRKNRLINHKRWLLAAACFTGIIGLSTYLLFYSNTAKTAGDNPVVKCVDDVKPGGKKAVLTLADGTTVLLDDSNNGTIAQQGNTVIVKAGGKLNYKSSGKNKDEVLYNTISTPVGGKYEVELPDGTLVWLNASSSLRFPTAFTGKERQVEITGEAYFEVARNVRMPFDVSANGAHIQVLGTHFNVMAYSDEDVLETTLLEGSVKFINRGNSALLKPGQQSKLSANGQVKVLTNVDVEKVIAWKNDHFDFEGTDFGMVARQLSRWYGVKVVYDRKIDDLFYAEIPRNMMLSDVLRALELTGKMRFKIEAGKVFVLP
jgi:transmembrane sensor